MSYLRHLGTNDTMKEDQKMEREKVEQELSLLMETTLRLEDELNSVVRGE